MKPTIKEKYNWLLSQLKVTDVDFWEGDALIRLQRPLYFQFAIAQSGEVFTDKFCSKVKDVDRAVKSCMGYR